MLLPISEVKEVNKLVDFDTKMHEAALLYAQYGWYVVPLRPKSKILPDRKTGLNYQSASANRKTINKWFGPEGRYRGWNIGLACGRDKGIFAIDLDLHGRENGIENWELLSGKHGTLTCPTQQTPTGGRHLIVEWKENLTSSSGKLCPGVDTRGGDGVARSHVVAWPSVTDDGAYEWLDGGDVPEAPGWLVETMGVPWNVKTTRGNENVGDGDGEETFSLSHIAAMLDSIDVDKSSYEEWLFVGQAINSQHPDKDGLELWDGWSANGERYQPGECHRKWPGFNPAGTIRIGTLIYFAMKGGYDPNTDPLIRGGNYEELVKRMNEDNAVLLTGGKIRIVHHDDRGGIHIMGTHDFNTLMFNKKVTVPGSKRKFTEADIWMAHEARRECIMGMGFFPDESLWHDGYVNMWQGWGCEPVEGDWSLFDTHILNILCGGDKELYDFVIDWVADILQDPMNPKGVALVMHGKEGTGKGTFCHIVGEIIGRKHYKHVTNDRHLTGNFNYHLMDGLLIFADEVVYGGSRSTAGILKSMVTEKELVCERKGIDSFMYANRSRVVVASNEDWFIPAGPESRRWLVLEVDDSVASNRAYFDALYDQMESGGYEAMMFDLLARKISSNLTKAIETEGLHQQRAIYKATGDAVDMWMDDCIARQDLGCPDDDDHGDKEGSWPTNVDRILLYDAFVRWEKEKKGLRTKGSAHFYKKVESYGFIKHRPRAKGNATRRYQYKVPPVDILNPES